MKKITLSLLCALLLGGCASIISGTSQAVTIDSNVAGATVSIEGSQVGVTPFSGKIPRKKESIAVVSKPGYGAQSLTLTTSFNPVAILSIFWDYSTTDCLTGACWEYAPSTYYVNLRPATASNSTFRRDSEVKAFAMTYFSSLRGELASGSGEKLEALHKAYFAGMTAGNFISTVRSIEENVNGSAVAFGEALAAKMAIN
jgi:uncharacterized protein YceK